MHEGFRLPVDAILELDFELGEQRGHCQLANHFDKGLAYADSATSKEG